MVYMELCHALRLHQFPSMELYTRMRFITLSTPARGGTITVMTYVLEPHPPPPILSIPQILPLNTIASILSRSTNARLGYTAHIYPGIVRRLGPCSARRLLERHWAV
jgi:hypothetical protein